MATSFYKLVVTTANNLVKHGLSRSDAFKASYQFFYSEESKRLNLAIVTFEKQDGTTHTRVVVKNWWDVQRPMGGKSKEGLHIFCDLSKHIVNKYTGKKTGTIISTYNIIKQWKN